MKIPNKVIPVIIWQGHESPTHDDKLHLVHTVSELLQLLHPLPRLQVGVIPRPDGPHRSWLVASVGLGRVLEIRVRPSWAVDADVAGHVDVRASVWFAHYRHDSNLPGKRKCNNLKMNSNDGNLLHWRS